MDAVEELKQKKQKDKEALASIQTINQKEIQSNDPWWLQKAFSELGQKEIKGKESNPRIQEYNKYTTLGSSDDETPWCAAFMRWVFKQKGSAAARSFEMFGKSKGEFKRGAIVVLTRPSAIATSGHVALALDEYMDKVKKEWFIVCLGGNQGDQVSITKFPKSRLLCYRWPPNDLVAKEP